MNYSIRTQGVLAAIAMLFMFMVIAKQATANPMKIRNSLPEQLVINGVVFKRYIGDNPKLYIAANKLKYRRVRVLARNLRHRQDLHGKPYQPSEWYFVEVRNHPVEAIKPTQQG